VSTSNDWKIKSDRCIKVNKDNSFKVLSNSKILIQYTAERGFINNMLMTLILNSGLCGQGIDI